MERMVVLKCVMPVSQYLLIHVKYANIFIIYIGDNKPRKVYLSRNVYIMYFVQIKHFLLKKRNFKKINMFV